MNRTHDREGLRLSYNGTWPIHASWLNKVEHWLGIISKPEIGRGSFSSDKELLAKIEQLVATYQQTHCNIERDTAIADSILEELKRLYSQISGKPH